MLKAQLLAFFNGYLFKSAVEETTTTESGSSTFVEKTPKGKVEVKSEHPALATHKEDGTAVAVVKPGKTVISKTAESGADVDPTLKLEQIKEKLKPFGDKKNVDDTVKAKEKTDSIPVAMQTTQEQLNSLNQKTAGTLELSRKDLADISSHEDFLKKIGLANNMGPTPKRDALRTSRYLSAIQNGKNLDAFTFKQASDKEDAKKYRDFVNRDGKYNQSKDTDVDNEKAELAEGKKVEMEHTKNPEIAERIAKDHLVEQKESPLEYYKGLHMLERFMDKLKQKKQPEKDIEELDKVTKK